MNKHSIFHVVHSLSYKNGGPSRTVVSLTDYLSDISGCQVSLFSSNYCNERDIKPNRNAVCSHTVHGNSKIMYRTGIALKGTLDKHIKAEQPSLIHTHGLWQPVNHWAAHLSKKFNVPHIIQPRGMLEPWALSYKSWKKKAALSLFQRKDINSSSVIVATSQLEYNNIRRVGFENPVAIIPNGIEVGHYNPCFKTKKKDYKNILFLSRIHPKKGLLNLIEAWANCRPSGWRLQIAGPDEGGHLAEVMDAANRFDVQDSIDYLGEVDGKEKEGVYYDADIFVLPTFSENFGVVVAEALSYGIPVITTKGAPWSDLIDNQCGWWIDIGVKPLTEALIEATSLDDMSLNNMGELGREYVKRYDWQDIANKTMQMYSWVLGHIPKPDFIYLD